MAFGIARETRLEREELKGSGAGYKKLWQAEPQVGRHNQLFHFRLATLRELRIKYPPEWDNPPN